MPKLKLKQDPTFSANVRVPIPGAVPVVVAFTFTNRTRVQFETWVKGLDGQTKEEAVMAMATGWELEDEFNEDNVRELLTNYLGAFDAIFETYLTEITQAKVKN